MIPFFVQIKCQLGKSYEVANGLADAEIASEIYSTAGEFDLLAKFYVDDKIDIGHFVNELRAHILERVFKLDLFAHGHAVFGDGRAAEGLVDDHIAAARAERNRHGVGQLIHTGQELGPRGVVEH